MRTTDDRERKPVAHTKDGCPSQAMHEHEENVGALAACFAEPFAAQAWGRLAGLWHDLGKYQPEVQAYLRGEGPQVEHAIIGAWHARQRGSDASSWLPLAFVIAGHHTGLANLAASEEKGPTPLTGRLDDDKARILSERAQKAAPRELLELPLPALPERLRTSSGRLSRSERERLLRGLELWIRFLFSALIDADRLDTQSYYEPGVRDTFRQTFDSLPGLRQRLDEHIDRLASGAKTSPVNQLRAEVLASCRAAAEKPPGMFSLSVPTGGGKTLSAMSFALRHAERHGLRRVIAVIPFTSIIEQNAGVYREALGDANVIEHHSNLDPKKEAEHNKLASENWDAPIIVTTGVQCFETLFANRTSRCRKLHNMAKSVILLDEAQTLPTDFLKPILEVLKELRLHYGCSIVLSTATQPALERREALTDGLTDVTEIVADRAELARRLRRFAVTWPKPEAPALEWPELAAELARHRQVLAIVHRRQDARELAELLPSEGLFHLSALMCADHRKAELKKLKQSLSNGEPCRLVSTQLIEAGVDVDFPQVYRALGPLDSLIQAGGRCNREGRLERGQLAIFRAPTAPPPGVPKMGLGIVETMLRAEDGVLDLEDPRTVEDYFQALYHQRELDARGIQAARGGLNFSTVAHKFKLIDDYTHPVLVPYGEAHERLDVLRRLGPSRQRLRALQPFLVNVAPWHLNPLRDQGAIEMIHDVVFSLAPGYYHLYDAKNFGFLLDDEVNADPEVFVV